ncbi:hypothetical protein ASE07_24145 [Noviherbaspirillum sp. Root189]|nr:hypothetical protein ASE07_24145 [Noviherbaspirillum sp. Root189]
MNIAFIVTGLGMGGAENQVVGLADRFASLGHRVLVISMTGNSFVLPRSPAVRIQSLDMPKTVKGFVSAYRCARHYLREFKADVVHSHMVHANVFARLLRLTTDMPRLICTAHSINEGGNARMLAYRLTDWLADMTTSVSDIGMNIYIQQRAARPHKISTVHNGIDCQLFRFSASARERIRQSLDVPEGMQLILAVGRMTEAKDYGNLLQAMSNVLAQRRNCMLCIAGDGELRSVHESQARSLGIASRVRFLGLRRDIPDLMSAADLFVLSSAWEGLPLVVGEALACERLVVSTDAGGIREWLGDAGHIVPVMDANALANAMLHALSLDRHDREIQGRIGRERVLAHYSMEAVVERWLQMYQGRFSGSEESAHFASD